MLESRKQFFICYCCWCRCTFEMDEEKNVLESPCDFQRLHLKRVKVVWKMSGIFCFVFFPSSSLQLDPFSNDLHITNGRMCFAILQTLAWTQKKKKVSSKIVQNISQELCDFIIAIFNCIARESFDTVVLFTSNTLLNLS